MEKISQENNPAIEHSLFQLDQLLILTGISSQNLDAYIEENPDSMLRKLAPVPRILLEHGYSVARSGCSAMVQSIRAEKIQNPDGTVVSVTINGRDALLGAIEELKSNKKSWFIENHLSSYEVSLGCNIFMTATLNLCAADFPHAVRLARTIISKGYSFERQWRDYSELCERWTDLDSIEFNIPQEKDISWRLMNSPENLRENLVGGETLASSEYFEDCLSALKDFNIYQSNRLLDSTLLQEIKRSGFVLEGALAAFADTQKLEFDLLKKSLYRLASRDLISHYLDREVRDIIWEYKGDPF